MGLRRPPEDSERQKRRRKESASPAIGIKDIFAVDLVCCRLGLLSTWLIHPRKAKPEMVKQKEVSNIGQISSHSRL